MADEIITLNEAAKLLKCSRSKIYTLMAKGDIPCFRVGGQYRFDKKLVLSQLKGEVK
jgi:excisionase family DNA binding protein